MKKKKTRLHISAFPPPEWRCSRQARHVLGCLSGQRVAGRREVTAEIQWRGDGEKREKLCSTELLRDGGDIGNAHKSNSPLDVFL